MRAPNIPPMVKLILGLIYTDEQIADRALAVFSERFGPVDMQCGPYPFDHTTYYQEEMGSSLVHRHVSFLRLVSPDILPTVKLCTNRIESDLAYLGSTDRRVNLDPGYLSAHNLVLATTKGYSHRPYLSEGIYAELTYIYRKGRFDTLEWTYPDYKYPRIIKFFSQVREKYFEQLGPAGPYPTHDTLP